MEMDKLPPRDQDIDWVIGMSSENPNLVFQCSTDSDLILYYSIFRDQWKTRDDKWYRIDELRTAFKSTEWQLFNPSPEFNKPIGNIKEAAEACSEMAKAGTVNLNLTLDGSEAKKVIDNAVDNMEDLKEFTEEDREAFKEHLHAKAELRELEKQSRALDKYYADTFNMVVRSIGKDLGGVALANIAKMCLKAAVEQQRNEDLLTLEREEQKLRYEQRSCNPLSNQKMRTYEEVING